MIDDLRWLYDGGMPADDRLQTYRDKRDESKTPEPFGGESSGDTRFFVIQKHAATRLHYDLRLEHDGVLLSWAVPQGICLDPTVKRFAAQTEDHPIDYAEFEGRIPEGEYGAGPMIVWDRGALDFIEDADHGMEKGKLLFELHGYKVRGRFTLVRMKNPKEWLLIKKPDEWAVSGDAADGYDETSILTGRTVEDVGEGVAPSDGVLDLLTEWDPPVVTPASRDFELMLAEAADQPFDRKGWLFEIKYDGYRLVAHKADGLVTLRYRSGRDATATFPEIAEAVAALPVSSAVIDGEVVVLDDLGKPSFSGLQRRGMLTNPHEVAAAAVNHPVTFFGFDLPVVAGHDLRAEPLIRRKEALRLLVPTVGPVRYADHVETRGIKMYEGVGTLGLEGIMAKRSDSAYTAGRSDAWLKMRIEHEGTFAVIGYTEPAGSRSGFGALHLAGLVDGALQYAGRVGTGFTSKALKALHSDLTALAPLTTPVQGLPDSQGSTWVEPEMIASVRYREVTESLSLRHPVFDAMVNANLADLTSLTPEPTTDSEPVVLPGEGATKTSNLEKVFWPDEGYTKGDLITYHQAVAEHLLPYLTDRPLTLVRYPDGVDGKSFYQKNAPDFVPATVRTEWVDSSFEGGNNFFVVDNVEALVYVINLGAIPLHIRASRVGSIEQPDWCVLDLDPKSAPFTAVVEVAREIKRLCDDIDLPTFVKTSGKSGMHILIPMGTGYDFEQQKLLGELIARVVESRMPELATTVRSPSKRGDRVYIDFVQNGRGKLIAAPLCVRPVAGATVSAPLRWSEVTSKLDPTRFTISTMPSRLKRQRSDPFSGVLTDRPDIAASLRALASGLG